jgi:CheY-like chemotaxis protein
MSSIQNRAKRRVLIIDDDPTFGELASTMLGSAGISVRFHRGPFGSLQAIRESRSHVVLVDVNMPRLDGALLSRMIRTTFGPGTVGIVLCSNMEEGTLARLAASLDVDGAIPKAAFTSGDAEAIVDTLMQCPSPPSGSAAVRTRFRVPTAHGSSEPRKPREEARPGPKRRPSRIGPR